MQQKKQAEEIVKTTLRIPRGLAVELKHRAIDENSTMQELVSRILRTYLKSNGGRK